MYTVHDVMISSGCGSFQPGPLHRFEAMVVRQSGQETANEEQPNWGRISVGSVLGAYGILLVSSTEH